MKNYSCKLLVAASLGAAASVFGQTAWTGADPVNNNINDIDNWSAGLPTGGTQGTISAGDTVDINVFGLSGYDVVQNGGTAARVSGAGNIQNSSSWVLNDGIFDYTTGRFDVNTGSSFTVNGGTADIGTATAGLRIGNSSAASFLQNDGIVNVGQNLDAANGTFEVAGGTFTAAGNLNATAAGATFTFSGGTSSFLQLVVGDAGLFINGGATVIFTDETVGGSGLGGTGLGFIDFANGGTSLTIGDGTITPTLSYEAMWDNDSLLLDGQTKTDLGGIAFGDTPFVTTGSFNETLTLVPEPSAFGALAGLLALVALRRR